MLGQKCTMGRAMGIDLVRGIGGAHTGMSAPAALAAPEEGFYGAVNGTCSWGYRVGANTWGKRMGDRVESVMGEGGESMEPLWGMARKYGPKWRILADHLP